MTALGRHALLCLGILVAGCAHASPAAPAQPRARSPFAGLQQGMQVVMGTRLFIALEPPAGQDGATLLAQTFAVARAHDALLSDYQTDSPLSRLNRGELPSPTPAPLLRFLRRGRRYCALTSGAFDLTVGALSAAWRTRPLDAARLAAARKTVGCDKLHVEGRRALLAAGSRLDPGALGKGYAVDAMVALLRARGVRRAFIDFGGSSFYGLGAPDGRQGWPVLLDRDAVRRGSVPRGRTLLRDTGLSSSATLAGKRPHVVDPRSGELITIRRLAVVVSPSGSDAEALSTALVVDPSLRSRLARAFPRARLEIFTSEFTSTRSR